MSDKVSFEKAFGSKRLYGETQSGSEWSIPLFELAYQMAVIRTRNRGGTVLERLDGFVSLYEQPEDPSDHLIGAFDWDDFSHWVKFHSGTEYGVGEEWMDSDFYFK